MNTLLSQPQNSSQTQKTAPNLPGALNQLYNSWDLDPERQNWQLGTGMLVVIDTRIENYHLLAAGVLRGAKVLLLDESRDGIQQVTQALKGEFVKSLHLISHGSPGNIQLGSSYLSRENLANYALEIKSWGKNLAGAPLLIYGCNVAEKEQGRAFIYQLSQLTTTHVAATSTPTGNREKGGDWNLDFTTGKIESSLAFKPEVIAAYEGIFATFTASNRNQLINRINDANGNGEADTITLTSNINLNVTDIAQLFENHPGNNTGIDNGYSGLPEITSQITINGNGFTISRPDTALPFRFFYIDGGNLTLEDITLTGGEASAASGTGTPVANDDGGAIYNRPDGTVTINNSTLSNNTAADDGGAILNQGTMRITGSTLTGNTAIGDGGGDDGGGAIENDGAAGGGILIVEDSTISDNSANGGQGGGIRNRNNADLTVRDSTLDGNDDFDIFDEGGTPNTGSIVTLEGNNVIGETNFGSMVSIGIQDTQNAFEGGIENGAFTFTLDTAQDSAFQVRAQITGTAQRRNDRDYTLQEGAGISNIGNFSNTNNNGTFTTSFTFTVQAGATTGTIIVSANDDGITESVENLTLEILEDTIADTIAYSIGNNFQSLSIIDLDTPAVIIEQNDALTPGITVVAEGGTTNDSYTVSLSTAPTAPVTVTVTPSDDKITLNSAEAGEAIVLTFTAGTTSQTVFVDAVDDNEINDSPRTLITHSASGDFGDLIIVDGEVTNTVTAIVIDNDIAEQFEVNVGTIVDAPEGGDAGSFQITLDNPAPPPSGLVVNFAIGGGNGAVLGTDFTLAAGTGITSFNPTEGTLTIAPGATEATINVTAVADTEVDIGETVTISLLDENDNTDDGFTYSIGDTPTGVLDIIDSQTPVVAFADNQTFTVTESGTQVFTVNRVGGATTVDATVGINLSGGSADAADVEFPNTVTIPAGTTTATFTVTATDDTIAEATENAIFSLVSQNGTTTQDTTASLTILDNEAATVEFSLSTFQDIEADATSNAVTITRFGDVQDAGNVRVSITGGTAIPGTDYTAPAQNRFDIAFAAGQSVATVPVDLLNDAILDGTKTINFSLVSVDFTLGDQTTAVLNILDDEGNAAVEFADVNFPVDENSGPATVTLLRNGGFGQQTTVTVSVTGGTAQAGTDYTSVFPANVTFASGETSKTITVPIIDDAISEGTETINLALGGLPNDIGVQSSASITITDDDPGAIGFIDPQLGEEPFPAADVYRIRENGQPINNTSGVVLFRTGDISEQVTVSVGILNDNDGFEAPEGVELATPGTDFNSADPISVTFEAGSSTALVPIEIIQDDIREGTEVVIYSILDAGDDNVIPEQGIATLEIIDDENPVVNFASVSFSTLEDDADEGVTPEPNDTDDPPVIATITLTREGNVIESSQVEVNVIGGTAERGLDYEISDSPISISFGPTEITKTLSFTINPDDEIEENETIAFTINRFLGNASPGDTSSTTFTILDDEQPRVSFSVDNFDVNEGAGAARLILTRFGNYNNPSTVTISPIDGGGDAIGGETAGDGVDYLDFSPITVTFAPGASTASALIPIIDDSVSELDETVAFSLSAGDNATVDDQSIEIATLTINDNEGEAPQIRFQESVFIINEDGTGSQVITLVREGEDLTEPSFVELVLSEGGDNPATAGVDFDNTSASADNPRIVFFRSAEGTATTQTVQVTIPIFQDDLDNEGTETIIAQISNPFNALITPDGDTATINILDDIDAPNIEFSQAVYQVVEGDEEDFVDSVVVTLTRDGANTDIPSVVNVSLTGGTATAGDDFDNTGFLPSGLQVSFAAGETSATVTVPIFGDLDVDDAAIEEITFQVSPVTNASIGELATSTLQIIDNEADPVIQFSQVNYQVNESGGNAVITVQRLGDTTEASTVPVSIVGGDATLGTDFDDIGFPATVSFAAGETSQTITVPIVNDDLEESTETVEFQLGTPTNGQVNPALDNATLSIFDDDSFSTVQFSLTSGTVAEAEGGTTATLSVIRDDANLGAGAEVQVSIIGGTATTTGEEADIDATAFPVTVSFAPGETVSAPVTFQVLDDDLVEGPETVAFQLFNTGDNTVIGANNIFSLTIQDDEDAPTPTIQFDRDTYQVFEDGRPIGEAITLTRTPTSEFSAVEVNINGITAIAGQDFSNINFPLTVGFAPGQTVATFVVPIIDDEIEEDTELIGLTVTSLSNAEIGDKDTANLEIVDNEGVAALSTIEFAQETPFQVGEDGTIPEGSQLVTLIRTGNTNFAATVDISIVGGTATGGITAGGENDYNNTGFPLTVFFAPRDTIETVTVPVFEDGRFEPTETVIFRLGNAGENAEIGDINRATLEILDNDAPIVEFLDSSLLPDEPPIYNVNEDGTGEVIFLRRIGDAINLTPSSVFVEIVPEGTTATAGEDYSANLFPIRVDFAQGEAIKQFSLPLLNDDFGEPIEEIQLRITPANTATTRVIEGQDDTATVIITDDDPATVQFSQETFRLSEEQVVGSGEETQITLTRFGFDVEEVTSVVQISITGGTARQLDGDFTATSPISVTFAPGETNKTIDLGIVADGVDEGVENVTLALFSEETQIGRTDDATVFIYDTDERRISFAEPVYEINEDGSLAGGQVTVTRTGFPGVEDVVQVVINGGTATGGTLDPFGDPVEGADYNNGSFPISVTFAPGESSKTVSIQAFEDELSEGPETILLGLDGDADIIDDQADTATVRLLDNDPPTVQFSVVDLGDFQEGVGSFVVSLTRIGDRSNTSTVNIELGGEAELGTDFTLGTTPLSVTFAEEEATQVFTVNVIDDSNSEPAEDIIFNIVDGTNIVVDEDNANLSATATIIDNDPAAVRFANVTFSVTEEGIPLPGSTLVTVERIGQTNTEVVAQVSLVGGTATGGEGADEGIDFDNRDFPVSVTFAAGETIRTISVPVFVDDIAELIETVELQVVPTQGANLAEPQLATLQIVDEQTPQIEFTSTTYTLNENGTAAEDSTLVTLTRIGNPNEDSFVQISVVPEGTTAAAGTDYTEIFPLTVRFAAGETTKTVAIPLINDRVAEDPENIVLQLDDLLNGDVVGTDIATVTVLDDDEGAAPAIQFGQTTYRVIENDLSAVVTLTREGNIDTASSVQVSITGGTADAAADYDATGFPVTANFAAGETTTTFTVPIVNDTLEEGTETVTFSLINANNAIVGEQAAATLEIIDDESDPIIRFSETFYEVGEEEGAIDVITVTREGNTSVESTVQVSIAGGDATPGTDFDNTGFPLTVTFAAGETSAQITIPITQDAEIEGPEDINLELVNATNGDLDPAQSSATVQINDDEDVGDPIVQFSQPVYEVNEDGTVVSAVTLVRTGVDLSDFSFVQVSITGGDAEAGEDYSDVNFPLTVSFAPDQTSRTITVPVLQDNVTEGTEEITFSVSDLFGAAIGSQDSATLQITDDDTVTPAIVQFGQANYSVTEGEGVSQVITLVRSGNAETLSNTTQVQVSLAGGSATPGADFNNSLFPQTVTFAAGETTASLTVDIVDDSIVEATETVAFSVTGVNNATIGAQATATLSIFDDDSQTGQPSIQFSQASYTVAEGDGTVNVVTLTRSGGDLNTTSQVALSVTGGTATGGGVDYSILTNSTVSFAAGETSKTVTVNVVDDNLVENTETVNFSVTALNNADIGTRSSATLSILDNDGVGEAPTIEFSASSYLVNENAGNSQVVTLTRTGGEIDEASTVRVSITGGTATAGQDYTATGFPQTVSFAAGETTKTLTVPIIDDNIDEPVETVNFSVTGVENAAIGTQSTATLSIQDNDPTQTQTVNITNDDGIFSLGGDSTDNVTLQFLLSSSEAANVNEVGVFVTDENGAINGIEPDDAGYIEAALTQSQVLFSALSKNSALSLTDQERIIGGFNGSQNLVFYLVGDSTTDSVLEALDSGQTAPNVFFSSVFGANEFEQAQISSLQGGGFEISFEDLEDGGNTDDAPYGDLVLSVESVTEQPAIGTQLFPDTSPLPRFQGRKELFDLTDYAGQQVRAVFNVDSDSGFNNRGGLYIIQDTDGTVLDAFGNEIAPGENGYADAALAQSKVEFGENDIAALLSGGFLYAPYLLADGDTDAAYFAFPEANPGDVDHVRILGDNLVGFEDLEGGGDQSYDDLVFRVDFSVNS
ncbi:MAG: Calx-beta domain-containing protein [Oscillatoria sp. PMC 1068.18]|nr:Calx-beta domain-containing protein [Oscillatoria sp. PMC 1076.18]MEC4987486.1 Calx-beta domain-containing protein [Oscillatoria sp. PMC 1068.18]